MIASCGQYIETRISPYPGEKKTAKAAEVVYEADESPEPDDDASARLATYPKGKITIQYMNNEREVYSPSSYSVLMWHSDAEPATPTAAPTVKATYRVFKKDNGRSYVRKTIRAGWYIAQYLSVDNDVSPGGLFKFQVVEGSSGLLCYNENSFTSVHFRGYYPAFGKVKCSWKTVPGPDDQAYLTLSKDSANQDFWLYAEDGTGKYKGQFWFMPVGTYSFSLEKAAEGAVTRQGTVTIAATGKFPHLKFY